VRWCNVAVVACKGANATLNERSGITRTSREVRFRAAIRDIADIKRALAYARKRLAARPNERGDL
jgi:hypothetical protein